MILEMGIDITEQKRAQNAIKHANAYHRSLIEVSIDPLVTIDAVGKIMDANKATEEVTGYTREKLIGTDFSDYFTEPEKARTGYKKVFEDSLITDYELVIKHKDGRLTPVLYNASVYRNESGEIAGIFASAKDITRRKLAENIARQANAYHRNLIEVSLDPLVTISPEGKITDVNEATVKVTGVERDRLIGTDFSSYFTEPDKAREGYLLVFSKGSVKDYPLTIRHKDGSFTDVLYNASVYKDEEGNVLGIFAAARDITERKRAEDELNKYRQHLEELVRERTAQLENTNAALEVEVEERKQIEKSLDAERANLQNIFDVVNVGMLLVDKSGNVQRINNVISRWVGKESAEISGIAPGNILGCINALSSPLGCGHTEHCANCPLRNAFESVINFGKSTHSAEANIVLSVGGKETPLWFEISVDPVVLNGQMHAIVAMNNITGRKKTEVLAKQSALRFELLAFTAKELLQSSRPQEIVNSLCAKVMEYLDCHVFFNFLTDKAAGKLRLNAYAGIPEVEAKKIEWLSYGVAVCGCVAEQGCRIVAEHIPTTPDKRTELVKSYGIKAYACHPLIGAKAEVIGTLSFGTRSRETFSEDDLSLMKAIADQVAVAISRIKNVEELREMRDYLESIFNYSNAPFICWDAQSKITRFNRAFESLTNYEQSEVIGKDLSILFPYNTRQDSLDKIKRALTGEHWEVVEIPIMRKDGQTRIALWNSANIYAQDGKALIATIAQGQDITERKRAEEELKRSNENLEQFAYVASHDLQEPLRVMASYSQLLEKRYKDKLDKDAVDFIDFIVVAAKRMQSLITDLLTYSRVGRLDAKTSRVDCNEILGKVIYGLSQLIEENKAVVTNDVLPVLEYNENSFIQIFQNLIQNAIKFRGAEPVHIHIGAKKKFGEWIFSVSDNGIGIEERYRDKIFLIFQRLHARDKYSGTGIGLSICKKIVEAHGGKIWVESEINRGSTFYFVIPEKIKSLI